MPASHLLVAMPVLAFLLIARLLRRASTDPDGGRRGRWLLAAVVWGLSLTALTEGLSLLHGLSVGGLALAWGAVNVALLAAVIAWPPPPELATPRPALPLAGALALAGVGGIIATTALVAWLAPPNDGDSLSYHMSRVPYWQQSGSVEHRPTFYPLQICLNPGAEFLILHLQTLSGGDRWATLVQWASMLGSLVGVSLVAKELGGEAPGQVLATVLAATIPMGILQASTTQNDYVHSFWLVVFVYFTLRLRHGVGTLNLIGAGGALGLAILSKGTAYVFAAPFAAWLAWNLFSQLKWRAFGAGAVIALLVILPNGGHYLRNWNLYQHPLGNARILALVRNSTLSPGLAFSNLLRNVALHAAVPFVGPYSRVERAVGWAHERTGLDVDDPRSTFSPERYRFALPRWPFSESYQGNPFHLYLGLATCALMAVRGFGQRPGVRAAYLMALGGAVALYCVLIRWQPPGSRLQLPLFVLATPWMGVALERLLRPSVNVGLAALFLASAVPCFLFAQGRPLVGPRNVWRTPRLAQYFTSDVALEAPCLELAQHVRAGGYRDLGLYRVGSDYLVWAVLGLAQFDVRIEHVAAHRCDDPDPTAACPNESFRLAYPAGDPFIPDAIVAEGESAEELCVGELRFVRTWSAGPFALFARAPGPS